MRNKVRVLTEAETGLRDCR